MGIKRVADPRGEAAVLRDAAVCADVEGPGRPGVEEVRSVRRAWARRRAAEIAAGLRGLRLAAGLTQGEVAARVGTKRAAVSRWESGHYGGMTVARLVEVLSVCARKDGAADDKEEQ